ncbi:MAG: UDP-glucose 4-epimerase GalE [bacterium]
MTIAVTNSGDYPGAHMILHLMDEKEPYLALCPPSDIPSPHIEGQSVAKIDISDAEHLASVLKARRVREVIHFAGGGTVPQSIGNPLACYQSNLVNTYSLLRACVIAGVKNIVMTSTSSVYGRPERVPIAETTPLNPISPYGSSMAMAERVATDIAAVNKIGLVILRYFNIAGADPKGRAGEEGKPRNLIKVVSQIAAGTRKEKLQIYGTDYQTPDGTAIRDYLHVSDMASAIMASLQYLRDAGQSRILNCGYGQGISVLEIVAAAERLTNTKIACDYAPRRAGDPPQLIADNAAIRSILDWTPHYNDVDFIVRTAIDWEIKCQQQAA